MGQPLGSALGRVWTRGPEAAITASAALCYSGQPRAIVSVNALGHYNIAR